MKKVKYTVKRSTEPNEEGKWIVFLESETNHGYNYGRIFKGTKEQCQKLKSELEEKQNGI